VAASRACPAARRHTGRSLAHPRERKPSKEPNRGMKLRPRAPSGSRITVRALGFRGLRENVTWAGRFRRWASEPEKSVAAPCDWPGCAASADPSVSLAHGSPESSVSSTKGAKVRAIGLDVHRDFCEVAIAEAGKVRSAGRIASATSTIAFSAASSAPQGKSVAAKRGCRLSPGLMRQPRRQEAQRRSRPPRCAPLDDADTNASCPAARRSTSSTDQAREAS
jgi:hypothetical protein